MSAPVTFPNPSIKDLVRPVTVEVVKFHHIGNIVVKFVDPPLNNMSEISREVVHWIESSLRGERIDPKPGQYCLVKWPKYFDGKKARLALGPSFIIRNQEREPHPILDVFTDDYKMFGGKWYRAECLTVRKTDGASELPDLYEMYLVDIGKTTLIDGHNVFAIPEHLMKYPTVAFRLSLYIPGPGLTVCDESLNNKWKYLLLHRLQFIVKVFWISKEVFYSKLITPTKEEFQAHYESSDLQAKVAKLEAELRKKKLDVTVRNKVALKKGKSFPTVMKEELEIEAAEKKKEPLKNMLAGLGNIHHDRVFKLTPPNPIPKRYRDVTKYEVLN